MIFLYKCIPKHVEKSLTQKIQISLASCSKNHTKSGTHLNREKTRLEDATMLNLMELKVKGLVTSCCRIPDSCCCCHRRSLKQSNMSQNRAGWGEMEKQDDFSLS
ncbi:hypothetical protein ILYODFUR_026254 [Ilyodon furcidens]|uniref:Uncharacterized protein n=1 Tax=Ilyodon furcidens TaxID=33524 RepID=A0ABV0TQK4_9TELE